MVPCLLECATAGRPRAAAVQPEEPRPLLGFVASGRLFALSGVPGAAPGARRELVPLDAGAVSLGLSGRTALAPRPVTVVSGARQCRGRLTSRADAAVIDGTGQTLTPLGQVWEIEGCAFVPDYHDPVVALPGDHRDLRLGAITLRDCPAARAAIRAACGAVGGFRLNAEAAEKPLCQPELARVTLAGAGAHATFPGTLPARVLTTGPRTWLMLHDAAAPERVRFVDLSGRHPREVTAASSPYLMDVFCP